MSDEVAVKIEQMPDRVTLSGPAVGARPVTLTLASPERVREISSHFVSRLDAVQTSSLKLTPKLAMTQLSGLAEDAFESIVLSTTGSRPKATQALAAAAANVSLYSSRAEAQGRITRVVIESTDDAAFLPWEWLGPQTSRPDPDGSGPNDVVRVGLGLLGLCDTQRSFRSRPNDDSVGQFRVMREKLQVRVFWHPELATRTSETRYFDAHNAFRLAGPFPDPPSMWVGQLPSQLANPRHGLSTRDHAVHFACHHRVEADPNDPTGPDSLLDFGSGPATARAADLERGLLKLSLAGKFDGVERPLVFLNLCRGDFVPGSLSSLAKLLLQWDNPTVVTTTATIDARFAAAMARKFYALLRQSLTAGAALRGAKLHMLEQNSNPLGLIYTLYGNGSFRLVSGEIAAAAHHR